MSPLIIKLGSQAEREYRHSKTGNWPT